jgi:hypothetical protein
MNKDLKILAINNVTFEKPLSSKEAFKEYRKEQCYRVGEALREMVKEHPHLDLVENTAPIGSMKLLTKED